MEQHVVAVDLPDGSHLALLVDAGAEPVPEVRRELRLWARASASSKGESEPTRVVDGAAAVKLAESLAEVVAAGVIGNAAWESLPHAARYMRALFARGHEITDVGALTERLTEALAGTTTDVVGNLTLVEARKQKHGGWAAVIDRDGELVSVATDPRGNVVLWKALEKD